MARWWGQHCCIGLRTGRSPSDGWVGYYNQPVIHTSQLPESSFGFQICQSLMSLALASGEKLKSLRNSCFLSES